MKQVEECVGEEPQENTEVDLQYPTIPFHHPFTSLLAHSHFLAMASTGDDSSVDETMSSIEESVWDIIDEASVATSDDEDRNLSRQQTPSSDGNEQEADGRETSDDIETSSENQGFTSQHFGSVHQETTSEIDESWNSEVTNFRVPQSVKTEEDKGEAYQQEAITFNKGSTRGSNSAEVLDAWHFRRVFEGEEREKICHDFRLRCLPQKIIGTIRQQMSREPLKPTTPYKVLYVGPDKVKHPIIQKISAVLAYSLNKVSGTAASSSSRYSIVPISAFESGSEPEVVLVNHMGLEICIEECTPAYSVREESGNDAYRLPNLAIIFVPENEEVEAKQRRILARSFTGQHNIPTIVLSEFGWKRPTQAMTLDHRTPHFCIEYDGLADQPRILKRLPIDLSSFLNIEATEMSRNLACISGTNGTIQSDEGRTRKLEAEVQDAKVNIGGKYKDCLKTIRQRTPPAIWSISRLSVTLILGLLVSTAILHLFNQKLALLSKKDTPDPVVLSTLRPSASSISTRNSFPTTVQSPSREEMSETGQPFLTKSLSALHTNTDLASFLLESHTLAPNTSDKFKLHVIGDCHVVLRPPHWFTALKRAPKLLFNIHRGTQSVDYQFSTLFDGVYALKLAKEDAYGPLNVTVWTVKKPRFNETFQVDFGSPWLNVAGWKRASRMATEQVREELYSAQTGLTYVYEQTSTGIQAFVRGTFNRANCALKEVEKAGMISFNKTAKTTGIVITQSMELSYTLSEQLHRHNIVVTSQFRRQRENLHSEIASLTQKMSSLFSHQSRIISQAAARLNVVALANEIQEYRETHLVESQKQAIRMWWTMRGGPPKKFKGKSDGLPKPYGPTTSKKAPNR